LRTAKGEKMYTNKILICLFVIVVLFLASGSVFAQTQKDIQEIKERLARLEERVSGLDKGLNKRIDDLDNKLSKRIDDLANLLYVILAGMFALVGFVIWDRRTALAPAIRKSRDLEEREEKLERALKEFAMKNPEMRDILKNLGLF